MRLLHCPHFPWILHIRILSHLFQTFVWDLGGSFHCHSALVELVLLFLGFCPLFGWLVIIFFSASQAMSSPRAFLTDEQRELMRSMSFGNNSNGSDLASPRSTITSSSSSDLHNKHGKTSSLVNGGASSKHERRSHSGKLCRPKKGKISDLY